MAEARFYQTAVVPGVGELSTHGGGTLQELQGIFKVRIAALRTRVLQGLHDEVLSRSATCILRCDAVRRNRKAGNDESDPKQSSVEGGGHAHFVLRVGDDSGSASAWVLFCC